MTFASRTLVDSNTFLCRHFKAEFITFQKNEYIIQIYSLLISLGGRCICSKQDLVGNSLINNTVQFRVVILKKGDRHKTKGIRSVT